MAGTPPAAYWMPTLTSARPIISTTSPVTSGGRAKRMLADHGAQQSVEHAADDHAAQHGRQRVNALARDQRDHDRHEGEAGALDDRQARADRADADGLDQRRDAGEEHRHLDHVDQCGKSGRVRPEAEPGRAGDDDGGRHVGDEHRQHMLDAQRDRLAQRRRVVRIGRAGFPDVIRRDGDQEGVFGHRQEGLAAQRVAFHQVQIVGQGDRLAVEQADRRLAVGRAEFQPGQVVMPSAPALVDQVAVRPFVSITSPNGAKASAVNGRVRTVRVMPGSRTGAGG